MIYRIKTYKTNKKQKKKEKKKTKNMQKLEKKYAPTLDNHGQSCFVRSDLKKMKCLFVRPDIDTCTWFVRLSPPTVLELQL
jgi:hypothetical protein